MLCIIAHHYVVNSPLMECIKLDKNSSITALFLLCFSAFGKTAINGFVIITGYFMCKTKISAKKFIKLIGEVLFYNIVIYFSFTITGIINFSGVGNFLFDFIKHLIPVKNIEKNFTDCFLLFYLLIPVLNILIQNMSRKQHEILCLFLFFFTSLWPSLGFSYLFNYVTWFSIIYIYGSYIRFYGEQKDSFFGKVCSSVKTTGAIFGISIILSFASIVALYFFTLKVSIANRFYPGAVTWFLNDSNKVLSLFTGISGFLFFKNLNIPYNKAINKIAASTFGVLCIHANSDAMRSWLWGELLAQSEVYKFSITKLVYYSFAVVGAVFIICTILDMIRIATIEKWYLKFCDKVIIKWKKNKE